MALALEAAIPLAPPSQVGRWVETLVGDSLAERTEQIAGIERLVDGGAEATSSALMTIGAGGPAPANEQTDVVTGARAVPLSRMDRTSPTQVLSTRPADVNSPTVVDWPAATPVAKEEALAEVSGVPRRWPRRVLVAVALLLVPLAAYGGVRTLRRGVTASPALAALTARVSPAQPASITSAMSAPHMVPPPVSSEWRPVPTAQPSAAEATPDPQPRTTAAAGGPRRAPPVQTILAAQPAQTARPIAGRGQAAALASAQATPAAETPAVAPAARPPAHQPCEL